MRKHLYWIAGIVLSGWCVWQLVANNRTRPDDARLFIQAQEGDTVCRPNGKPWNTSGAGAIVIVINHGCPFCTVSKPFETQLEEQGRSHGTPTIYALSSDDRNADVARDLQQQGKTVIRIQPQQFGVTGVPTFMRVNDQGVIQALWRGTVPDERRASLISALTEGRTALAYDIVPAAEFHRYATDPDYQMLALSEIGLAQLGPSAKVIPLNQLEIRAPYELEHQRGVVVDCQSAPFARDCQMAAWMLYRMKFARVIAMGLPSRSGSCTWADSIRRVL